MQIIKLAFASFVSLSMAANLPPQIETLVKPEVYKRVSSDSREVITSAHLEDPKPPTNIRDYQIYGIMLVRASIRQTRETLIDYPLYAKIIPYVDRSDYDSKSKTLWFEGGIWKFKMASKIRFEEKSETWLHYDVVDGSFKGMQGEMYFESRGEKGTLVYFQATHSAVEWPPKLIIEKGAEIVFSMTGSKMRRLIEDRKREPVPSISPNPNFPTPRGKL